MWIGCVCVFVCVCACACVSYQQATGLSVLRSHCQAASDPWENNHLGVDPRQACPPVPIVITGESFAKR